MQLEILHPEVARRDCEHCHKYLYDEESGQPVRQETTGNLVLRIKQQPPPCRVPPGRKQAPGCPKGTPEQSNALSSKNRAAYRYHLKCEALGRFPADGIVEQNAGLIALARDMASKQQAWLNKRHQESLQTLIAHAIRLRTI